MTDRIAEAARATRKWRCDYFDHSLYADGETSIHISCERDLVAACDRLNLLAVLEALREPSEGMDSAGHKAGLDRFGSPTAIWRAMIDAAIKEAAERRAVNAGETE